jgi:hypothetical protein
VENKNVEILEIGTELCLHHETIKKSTYLFLENGFKVLPGPRLHSSPVPSVSGTTYYH